MTQTASRTGFPSHFQRLTKYPPLRWQERLFHNILEKNEIPPVIDLPTGLGKTMVMAIWLIARAVNKELPRRLIYVVDRRTVVDQATTLAIKFQRRIQGLHRLARRRPELGQLCTSFPVPAISTLRGQLADNRDWARDPSRPAIIIGTVDMIGSRLLFSGYRSSYKQRPLDAGLLGQDSLLLLDEAHLSKPFEKLLKSITEFQSNRGSPIQVIRMTATSTETNETPSEKVFRLETDPASPTYDLQPDPDPQSGEERNQIITRYRATKCLRIEQLGESRKLNGALAQVAIKLANDGTLAGKRIVIFVRSPEDAKEIAKIIKEHDKPSKSKSNPDPKGPYADSVELLTGTMRGLERDKLVKKPVFKNRWLNGKLDPSDPENQQPVFLVSTSAGEVGFDLNADHLVGDDAPLDSWIQRLGRVNRRGSGDATVILIRQEKAAQNDFDKACIATSKLFTDRLDLITDRMDVSPKALDALKKALSPERIKEASTPEPTMIELTDILLDAWSMTSITERMPGRPEVGPWLRGVGKDLPRTTIAWRAELDLFKKGSNLKKAFKAIFAKHRIRPHESLTTNSSHVVEFLKAITNPKKGRPELRDTRVVLKFSRDLMVTSIGELIDDPSPLNADPTLILPPSFGGLDSSGMLSHEAILSASNADVAHSRSLDCADKEGYEPRDDARPRICILIEPTDDGWKPLPLPDGEPIPDNLHLDALYKSSTLLLKAIVQADLRIRLVQPVSFDEEGDPVQSLVCCSPVGNKLRRQEQLLTEHVDAVEANATWLAEPEQLDLKDPIRAALLFAAKWHDEGKKAEIWQRFIGGPDMNGEPLGKAATTRDPKLLRGYRHEFGSLLRILHPDRHPTACSLPTDVETHDLALHLIATHHGFGRPHYDNPTDRDFQTKHCNAIHAEIIRRFARLQRKYGWWYLAWLENLLRCADALASADDVSEDDVGEGNQESGEDS